MIILSGIKQLEQEAAVFYEMAKGSAFDSL